MSSEGKADPVAREGRRGAGSREERLAAELRDNLRKRKRLARARDAREGDAAEPWPPDVLTPHAGRGPRANDTGVQNSSPVIPDKRGEAER